MSKDSLPHVPVGKLYYRVQQPEISNHGGQQFKNLRISVGVSQRYSASNEVDLTLQSDSDRRSWYALRFEVHAEMRAYHNEENPFRIADKIRQRFVDEPSLHSQDCCLRRLACVFTKMRLVHAVYDTRTSRMTAVKDLLPEAYHAWRDDWRQMGRDYCAFDAVARDEEEARAMMVLQAKRGDAGDAEYLKVWLAAGAPLKRLTSHGSPPYVGTLDQFIYPLPVAAAA
jgi:hypothetical protein